MAEERTYRITCNECGYSEEVPESRLPYQEGKTCPRCYKGKMYWVPPAEEARRISPAVIIIPVGLGLGLAAALGIATLARAAPPTPPPGRANLYGMVTDADTGEPIPGVLVSINGMEAYTDATGNYAFADLDLGTYSLFFQKGGYEEIEMADITLQEGNNVLDVPLSPIPPPVANLYGMVTDAETGSPLSGVKVTIDGLVTYTDASGNYGFTGLTPGNYTVTFEKEGYETEVR